MGKVLSRADSFSGLDPTVTPASKADKRGPGIDEVIEDVGMVKPDLQEGSPGNDEDQAECNKSKASGQLVSYHGRNPARLMSRMRLIYRRKTFTTEGHEKPSSTEAFSVPPSGHL